ncbi:Uncharacterised protein [Dermatophilus congolensis]|uniref:Uncharacterized protein n=1 Tax=Dermatophilus congolensis TaxID=1863 RepID=A0AA46H1D8_9MICO|nr:hypothetical protein [Dermatophilus congolensis]STD14657.1 Uncharacterised protein [Dermatophilus congolensis]
MVDPAVAVAGGVPVLTSAMAGWGGWGASRQVVLSLVGAFSSPVGRVAVLRMPLPWLQFRGGVALFVHRSRTRTR